MATPFISVFDKFLETEIDDNSFSMYTDDLQYKKLSNLLFRARSKFRDIIISNNLTENKSEDVIPFQRETYSFTSTLTSETFVLSPAPPENSNFYVSVNDIETYDYIFDSINNEVTINNMDSGDKNIYVGAYVNGQFNQTLNLTEFNIMVDLMGIYYLKDKVKKQTLIVQNIQGRDYSLSGTQANHIKSLSDLYNKREYKIEQDIILYAYRNFGYNISKDSANGYLG